MLFFPDKIDSKHKLSYAAVILVYVMFLSLSGTHTHTHTHTHAHKYEPIEDTSCILIILCLLI